MTRYELLYVCLQPFVPPLYRKVRHHLIRIARSAGKEALMLDVGCRTSPYTIAVPARFVLSDLPKTTELQEQLYLGLSGQMVERLYRRRSNVEKVILDDMTCSSLESGQVDCVVAVEVLEHVERDDLFVSEVHRVLKKGGVFLMTTPNGDYVENVNNPDHKRHYKRRELHDLLVSHFSSVEIDYAIRSGRFFKWGHDSWSVKHPLRTSRIMASNFINFIQSGGNTIKGQARGTEHLIAIATKAQ